MFIFFSLNFCLFCPPFKQTTHFMHPCHMKSLWQSFLASVCPLRIIELEESGNWYLYVKPRETEGLPKEKELSLGLRDETSAGSWKEGMLRSTLEVPKAVAGLQGKSPGDKSDGLDAKLRVLALLKSPCSTRGMEMTHWWTWWDPAAAAKCSC